MTGASEKITLGSCTVFWRADLGMTAEALYEMQWAKDGARKYLVPLQNWLRDNCKSAYRFYDEGVWFANTHDASLFKLFWAGQLG